MPENLQVRHSILVVFFLYGMAIRPPEISLQHISGSVVFLFLSSASLVLYSIITTLIGEQRAGLYVVVYR